MLHNTMCRVENWCHVLIQTVPVIARMQLVPVAAWDKERVTQMGGEVLNQNEHDKVKLWSEDGEEPNYKFGEAASGSLRPGESPLRDSKVNI